MNPEAQKKLNEILAKDISSLTSGDIIFLQARRDYLTDIQREKYQHFWSTSTGGDTKPSISTPKRGEKLAEFHELMRQAKEKGIKVPKGTKIEELRLMVS